MLRRITAPLTAGLLSALVHLPAHAVLPANLLPQAEFIETIKRLPGAVDPPGLLHEAESVPYADTHTGGNHTVTVEAHAVNRSAVIGSPILSVDGRAQNTGPIENGYEGVEATVEVNYYFEVQSTSDRTVPIVLPIEWSATATREDEGSALISWEVSITPQLNPFRGSAATSRTYIANASFLNTTAGEQNTTQLHLDVYTSDFDYYKVHMKLRGVASRLADSFFHPTPASGLATFSAVLDPLPHVDPAFANAAGVSLVFSENLFASSVPEPGAAWLLIGGAVPFACVLARRQRRRTA